jgi:hypothetical protein
MFTQFIAIIALLWAGMILGISFLESWAKFRAPSLTKAIGLDVGRTVFRFFHNVQNTLIFVIIGLSLFAEFSIVDWLLLCGLVAILSMQLFWLFPRLNQRANFIIAGGNPPSSPIHSFYGVTEIAKFDLLLIISIKLLI